MSFYLNINLTDSDFYSIFLQEVPEGHRNREHHPFLFLPETHTHTQHSQTAGVTEELFNRTYGVIYSFIHLL